MNLPRKVLPPGGQRKLHRKVLQLVDNEHYGIYS